MRIVYICQWNPWTLSGGALIRNAWLIRALSSRYEIDLVTADSVSSAVPADFARACATIWRFPRTDGTARKMRRVFHGLRPGASFYTSGNTDRALSAKVRDLLSRSGAVAMLDLKMVDALAGAPCRFIYNAHNTEHELVRRRADYEPQPARSLIRLESARVARIETEMVRNACLVAACSENDRRELSELVPRSAAKIVVVPNGVDMQTYSGIVNDPGDSSTVLITGSYDWRPNLIGLQWFLDDVLPELRKRAPDGMTIRIAGRMSCALAAELNAIDGVVAVANPADIREELRRAAIVAAPILPSSGTRLRILEAWAAGKPVVTTPAGALGLVYRSGEDLIATESAAGFADAIGMLLRDRDRWRRMRDAGIARAADYDWTRIGEQFLNDAAPIIESRVRTLA